MKIEEFIEHTNQLMAMGMANIEGLPLVDIKDHAEKQAVKPPTHKIDPDFPHIGPGYYCECGVRFEWWHRPEGKTRYCGNCGQRLME